LTKQLKISLALAGTFVVVVAGLLTLTAMSDEPDAAPVQAGESRLVRADSHVLGPKGSSDVTFVEFLDFECEGCLAAYPAIEQLREEYQGEVTFVVRHFPLHFNSERAARAVEAAAQRGKLEQMYQLMFDTAEQWGHQQEPADDVFLGYADDLGLDMAQFEADYENPATAQRVAKDVADGKALGVQGTPTFFVDGERLEPQSYDDLTEALDAALAD
jgi:protein-disulfide isomerase